MAKKVRKTMSVPVVIDWDYRWRNDRNSPDADTDTSSSAGSIFSEREDQDSLSREELRLKSKLRDDEEWEALVHVRRCNGECSYHYIVNT